jgi:tetratricopeptide (TPR) repeat protein
VASCGWLAFALAERGDFDSAQDSLGRARQAAEAGTHPYSQMIAWTLTGLVAVSRGLLASALLPLEKSLAASREKHLTVWAPIPSALLGLTFARLGRPVEGVGLLQSSVARSEELGVRAYLALWTTSLAEGLLAVGRIDEARVAGERALELARAHRERGHEAWAHRLLGQVAAADGVDPEKAAAHYEAATTLARALEMRPLLAMCHLGFGDLARRQGDVVGADKRQEQGLRALREVGMQFWLRPEAALSHLAHLFVVARWNADLHAFLSRDLAGGDDVTVLSDRRFDERRRLSTPHEPERRHGERRQNREAAEEVRRVGVAIIRRLR